MVGIVIVSHSRALATALVELVSQVSQTQVPIAISAGVGDDRQELGTDAVELMEAILEVHSPDGVVVLMDLGSAVLSAETALDFLPDEVRQSVRLCPAPLVEGAVAAAVQAGLGFDLDTVCREARAALGPKLEQIEPQASAAGSELEVVIPAPGLASLAESRLSVELIVRNLHGLHARPAAQFVKAAASFDADIQVRNLTNGKGPVSAKSLNGLATLGAVKGHQIQITALGPAAGLALETLGRMVEEGFGELETAPEPLGGVSAMKPETGVGLPGREAGAVLVVPVSEGIALGPFYRYQPPTPPISDERISDPALAWAGLQKAIASTRQAINQRRSALEKNLGERDAYSTAIFEAHELILQDPDLLETAKASIYGSYLNGAAAWDQAVKGVAESYRSLDDPYLKQRAIDVIDVGNQVLFALAGKTEGLKIELPGPVILFAEELTPTETSSLDMDLVLGLMTVGGGPTSHSAILARALSIPAISGVSAALESLDPGTLVGLDGFNGQLWIAPDAGQQSELSARRAAWLEERERLLRTSQELAATADGQRVEVVANVGSVQDAQKAAENGAEGIGLLRTEFLFLTRTTPPSEDEQYEELCQIGLAMTQAGQQDWPMIVRTLDVGGDKELPFVQLAPEANPFLGVRALRLSLRKPELFQPQLRAILRAGANYRFRVMFPMVANLDEVLQARQALEQAHAGLMAAGLPHRWPVEMGIMVEIPSAALLSRTIAPQVDFFSIGTNDLTQYTLAAERGNPLLSGLADALHPAVLRLIGEVAQAAHQYGKFTGVCGELAGDPLAVPVLVGLGVDELSMNPSAAPRAKAIVRVLKTEQARSLAAEVLAAPGAPEVRQIARDFFQSRIEPNLK